MPCLRRRHICYRLQWSTTDKIRILYYLKRDFDHPEIQMYRLNGAVLEFATLLRYGLDPRAMLFDLGFSGTTSEIASFNPHFTEIAWKLALNLSGWKLGETQEYGSSSCEKTLKMPYRLQLKRLMLRPTHINLVQGFGLTKSRCFQIFQSYQRARRFSQGLRTFLVHCGDIFGLHRFMTADDTSTTKFPITSKFG